MEAAKRIVNKLGIRWKKSYQTKLGVGDTCDGYSGNAPINTFIVFNESICRGEVCIWNQAGDSAACRQFLDIPQVMCW